MCLKCFLLLLTTTLVAAHLEPVLNGSFTSNRIIGGSNEVIENAPWQISLQYLGRHVCGGSIYSEEIIVTAAHCVAGRLPKDLRVRVGSTYHNSGGTLVAVARTLSHERFNRPSYANDIAVIRLGQPLIFGRSVQHIALAREAPSRKTAATVTGWGFSKKLPVSPTQLQSVKLRIMSHKICWKINFGLITNDMICAFDWKKGACNGDSGGPLVVNRELVGVVSFGKFMCFGPTVFANVAVQHDWILEAVKVISKQDSTEIPSTRPTTTESSTTTTKKDPSTITTTTKEPLTANTTTEDPSTTTTTTKDPSTTTTTTEDPSTTTTTMEDPPTTTTTTEDHTTTTTTTTKDPSTTSTSTKDPLSTSTTTKESSTTTTTTEDPSTTTTTTKESSTTSTSAEDPSTTTTMTEDSPTTTTTTEDPSTTTTTTKESLITSTSTKDPLSTSTTTEDPLTTTTTMKESLTTMTEDP